jgi:hypothetical protein
MKRGISCLVISIGLLSLTGCLNYERYGLEVDFSSGRIEETFVHFSSTEKNLHGDKDSVDADWKKLRELEKDPFKDKEKRPKGLKDVSTRLFEDGSGLSGTLKASLERPDGPLEQRLESLGGLAGISFSLEEGLIVAVLDGDVLGLSGNGKSMKVGKKVLVAWPEDVKVLKLGFHGAPGKGTSLLPYYLKEKAGPH